MIFKRQLSLCGNLSDGFGIWSPVMECESVWEKESKQMTSGGPLLFLCLTERSKETWMEIGRWQRNAVWRVEIKKEEEEEAQRQSGRRAERRKEEWSEAENEQKWRDGRDKEGIRRGQAQQQWWERTDLREANRMIVVMGEGKVKKGGIVQRETTGRRQRKGSKDSFCHVGSRVWQMREPRSSLLLSTIPIRLTHLDRPVTHTHTYISALTNSCYVWDEHTLKLACRKNERKQQPKESGLNIFLNFWFTLQKQAPLEITQKNKKLNNSCFNYAKKIFSVIFSVISKGVKLVLPIVLFLGKIFIFSWIKIIFLLRNNKNSKMINIIFLARQKRSFSLVSYRFSFGQNFYVMFCFWQNLCKY